LNKIITKKRRKKRKFISSPELEDKEESVPEKEKFSVDTRSRIDELTANLHLESIPDVNAQINEHLTTIQEIRRRTKNMKSSDKGKIKVLVEAIRVATRNMAIKASSSEDPVFWRAKYFELENQILELKTQNTTLTRQVDALRKNIHNRDAMEFPDFSAELDENELLFLSGSKKGDISRKPSDKTDAATNTSKNDNINTECVTLRDNNIVDLFGNTSIVRDKVDINISVIHAIDRLNAGMTQLAREIKSFRDRDERITVDARRNVLEQKRINNEVTNIKQHKTNDKNKIIARETMNPAGLQPRTQPKVKFDGGESDGSFSSSSVARISKRQRRERNYHDDNSVFNRNNTYSLNQRNTDFSSYTEEETFRKSTAVATPGEDSMAASSRDSTSWVTVVKRGRSRNKKKNDIRKENVRSEESINNRLINNDK